MPILHLKFKEKTIEEYLLEKGGSVTMGRGDNNDITIDNLAVSTQHAKIDSVGEGFFLTDLQSKNGSFVNEQLVTSHYLQNGDIITIGKHTLLFSYGEGEELPDASSSAMEQTMVMDTKQQREMLSKSTPKAKPKVSKKKSPGVLSYLQGGQGEIPLTKKIIKLGKDPSCDIVVTGFLVGKTAATISLRPKGYYFSYVSGFSKPKINDEAVNDTVILKEFDTIEIGSAKLQLILKKKK